MSESVENVDNFIEDAKILMDIHTICDSYWASSESLNVWSTARDYIDFSFRYKTKSFSNWEIGVIKAKLRKMGYEFTGFIIMTVDEDKCPYLFVRMRVASRRRKLKEGLRYIYRTPIRLYYHYRYWRNYGTWRY